MRSFFLFGLVAALAFVAFPGFAVQKLTNGDFENGVVGSNPPIYGGGWTCFDGGFKVIGPGWFAGAGPANGDKGIGLACNGGIAASKITQTIYFVPGRYKLTLRGYVWLFDSRGDFDYTSHADIKFYVGNNLVRCVNVYPPPPPYEAPPPPPQGETWGWMPVDIEWTGTINAACRLEIHGVADGRDLGQWGIVATDNWTLEATLNPPAESNLFTNGGFEQAGAVGGHDAGPGWTHNGGMTVIGPGWFMGVCPCNEDKAMGVAGNSTDASGLLQQYVNLAPGDYELTLTGRMWFYDNYGGDQYNSYVDTYLIVDGQTLHFERIQGGGIGFMYENWGTLTWSWRVHVNSYAGVKLDCQARGAGDSSSWGIVVVDDWKLLAVANPPEEPNLFTNGGFEQAGPIGSGYPGPGWGSYFGFQVIGPGWYMGAAPYRGEKAMGIAGHSTDATGNVTQHKALPSGDYDLVCQGWLWMFDNEGGDQYCSHFNLEWKVDGITKCQQRIYGSDPGFAESQWGNWTYYWSGHLNNNVSVVVNGEARGGGGPSSWGICVTDEWKLATPPTRPVVVDDGAYTTNTTQLHASWTCSDPDTGIVEYQYAIGSAPGASNVVNWTSVGTSTSVTKSGPPNYYPGHTYYVSVKALNGGGFWSFPGVSDGISVVVPKAGIAQAKASPDGTPVQLTGKAVSAKIGPSFWIEEADRSSGIRVNSNAAVTRGQTVTVSGKLATINGERCLDQAEAQIVGSATAPEALALANNALGGANLDPYTPGVKNGLGPNNVGLYVRSWGKVAQVGPAGAWFRLDDGSVYADASKPLPKVVLPSGVAAPSQGSFVVVTGISSCEIVEGDIRPVLLVPASSDVQVL